MTTKKMHPSVLKFKEFVKNNPKVIQEVRKGKATWQELYEDWYLLGEDDERWNLMGSEEKSETASGENDQKNDWMSNIMGMLKKVDPNQVQHHMNNLSQAIGAIQGLLSQFQNSNQSNSARGNDGPAQPFSFRKD
ncbi:YlbD family protein [Bacillota bacterium Lsc_1132]